MFRLIFSFGIRLARHSPKKMIAAAKLSAPTAWSVGCAVPKMPDKRPDCQIVNFADTIPRNKKNNPNIFIILTFLKVRFLPAGVVISFLARAVPLDLNVTNSGFNSVKSRFASVLDVHQRFGIVPKLDNGAAG